MSLASAQPGYISAGDDDIDDDDVHSDKWVLHVNKNDRPTCSFAPPLLRIIQHNAVPNDYVSFDLPVHAMLGYPYLVLRESRTVICYRESVPS